MKPPRCGEKNSNGQQCRKPLEVQSWREAHDVTASGVYEREWMWVCPKHGPRGEHSHLDPAGVRVVVPLGDPFTL